jgi:AIR synthase-related protein
MMMTSPLEELTSRLRSARGIAHKLDIQLAHAALRVTPPGVDAVRNGDDCAALRDGDGYLLFAIEGLLEAFVAAEPWFAGYCAVMVNVSDIAAMGGRPVAVVDALWCTSPERAEPLWAGMQAAAAAYGVPIVGGHTNVRSAADYLAVSIVGRAERLLTSFDAAPGDVLLAAIDLRGEYVRSYDYWNASTGAPAERLRGDVAVLHRLANDGLCAAAKDISMGGLPGTAAMLAECSGVGMTIDIDAVPRPHGSDVERWLRTFPSFGYLLSVPPASAGEVTARFAARDIACAPVGVCTRDRRIVLEHHGERATFWDLSATPFTGATAHAGA